ncbi:hypothetical protein P4O66_003892 [Electrophorus voltai]|uniref:Uncharacterized protein n=1 Tax=Electrophorus voltai TaxID=2609070 RepID=A0AAD9E1W7_9TELE|nr:hypothetical protein P4O66_003892 [Electrophorus voltai]
MWAKCKGLSVGYFTDSVVQMSRLIAAVPPVPEGPAHGPECFPPLANPIVNTWMPRWDEPITWRSPGACRRDGPAALLGRAGEPYLRSPDGNTPLSRHSIRQSRAGDPLQPVSRRVGEADKLIPLDCSGHSRLKPPHQIPARLLLAQKHRVHRHRKNASHVPSLLSTSASPSAFRQRPLVRHKSAPTNLTPTHLSRPTSLKPEREVLTARLLSTQASDWQAFQSSLAHGAGPAARADWLGGSGAGLTRAGVLHAFPATSENISVAGAVINHSEKGHVLVCSVNYTLLRGSTRADPALSAKSDRTMTAINCSLPLLVSAPETLKCFSLPHRPWLLVRHEPKRVLKGSVGLPGVHSPNCAAFPGACSFYLNRAPSHGFSKYSREQYEKLSTMHKNMQKLYESLGSYFAFDPHTISIEDFFGDLANFRTLFMDPMTIAIDLSDNSTADCYCRGCSSSSFYAFIIIPPPGMLSPACMGETGHIGE